MKRDMFVQFILQEQFGPLQRSEKAFHQLNHVNIRIYHVMRSFVARQEAHPQEFCASWSLAGIHPQAGLKSTSAINTCLIEFKNG